MGGWYYQHIMDELVDLKKNLDSLFKRMHETYSHERIPDLTNGGDKIQRNIQGNLRVDVIEDKDEVLVKADMITGDKKGDIKLDLLEPQVLRIFCERKGEKKDDDQHYSMCERSFGSMTRIVPLPIPVTEDGSKAMFKDGVLEVHLKRATKELKRDITIE